MIGYDTREPWENFANAIIIRATDDYISAIETLKQPKPNDPKKQKGWIAKQISSIDTIRNINRFFRSDWYSMLTKVDPEYIIQGLIKEHGNEDIIKKVNNSVYEVERINK